MNTRKLPQELAIDLLPRSTCYVQVAAVIADDEGRIVGWAWNHAGEDGAGMCAERAAIKRANPRRLRGSTIYVAGWWAWSRNWVLAKPCDKCLAVLRKRGIATVYHTTKSGAWVKMNV